MNLDDTVSSQWFVDEVQVHAPALRAWLRGRYPVLTDPENVVQEALTRVWRAAQSGPIHSPKALLFTTASHLALDELRRRKIATFDSLRDGEELSVFTEGAPAPEAIAHREELTLLTEAIQSLPMRCREVLLLRKQGLRQKEIAARLGISERAVEAHLIKGLKGCAKFLARFGLP